MLGQCSDKDDISVSDCLVSKMQNSWSIWNYFSLYWNYFISFLQFTPRDSLSSSPFTPDISKSKKMPKKQKFLKVFKKNYNALSKCDVIADCKQQEKYKIAKTEELRHAMIIISGPKHAFVLGMSCRKFKTCIYKCPDIRYISDENVKKMHLCYYPIEKSADELVQIAIETLSKMEDNDILKNNGQTFVQNYFCALGINNSGTNLKGRCTAIILLIISYIYYGLLLSEYYPLMKNVTVITVLSTLVSFFIYLKKQNSIFFFLIESIFSFLFLFLSFFVSKMGEYDILKSNNQNPFQNYFSALGIDNFGKSLEGSISLFHLNLLTSFVRPAIKTVSKMGDYDILNNNCRNFVKDYLEDLGINTLSANLEGEKANNGINVSSPFLICAAIIVLIIFHKHYGHISSEYPPLMKNVVVFRMTSLLVFLVYISFNRQKSGFFYLTASISPFLSNFLSSFVQLAIKTV